MIELPMAREKGAPLVSCDGCYAPCCRMVNVPIGSPTNMDDASYILYLLYHGLCVSRTHDGSSWFLTVEAKCGQLTEKGNCGIHEVKPVICKEAPVSECDRNLTQDQQDVLYFEPVAFLKWLHSRRPSLLERLYDHNNVPYWMWRDARGD